MVTGYKRTHKTSHQTLALNAKLFSGMLTRTSLRIQGQGQALAFITKAKAKDMSFMVKAKAKDF